MPNLCIVRMTTQAGVCVREYSGNPFSGALLRGEKKVAAHSPASGKILWGGATRNGFFVK